MSPAHEARVKAACDAAWAELTRRCAADPATARRVVMVSRADSDAVTRAVLALPWLRDALELAEAIDASKGCLTRQAVALAAYRASRLPEPGHE